MIEKRTHVVARLNHREEYAGLELWFKDGMAVWVSYLDWSRVLRAAGANKPVLVAGATAELENVEGRWVLARLELPK